MACSLQSLCISLCQMIMLVKMLSLLSVTDSADETCCRSYHSTDCWWFQDLLYYTHYMQHVSKVM